MSPSDYRLKRAVSEVEAVLAPLRRLQPDLVAAFPRRLDEMAILAADDIDLEIHLIVGLNEGAVSRWLATERALRSPELPETGGRELFGFLYCAGARAFVFVDPSYGEACARFTLAHELGHLFLEYRPLFDRSATQGNLFAMPPPANFFRRDGADTLARAIDSGSASAADVLLAEKNAPPARLNEVIANAFAAELLAPVDEVQRTVSGAIGLDAYVERVEKKFGLSRRAATIRVLEIFGSSPGRQRSLEGV